MPRTVGALMIVATGALLAACGGGGGGGGGRGDGTPQAPAPVRATLDSVSSCTELRDAIAEDARGKIRVQAERLRAATWLVTDIGGHVDPTPVPTASPAAQAPGDSPRDFTDTNTQVEGVDEADVVETDGAHIYLLSGGELLILDAFPPETTALAARVSIEGSPIGMFVAGNRALVVSQVYDDSGDLGGDDACRWIGSPFPEPLPVGRPASEAPVVCGALFTKITLIDLAGGANRVAREIFIEGSYVGARRHGGRARVIVQRGWGLPSEFPDPWIWLWSPDPPASQDELVARVDAWERAAIAAIDASTLDDWMPAARERVAGTLVEVAPRCDDAHVPAPGLSEHGLTRIVALDVTSDDGALRDTLVVGGTSQVYASGDTLVLAQPNWDRFAFDDGEDRTALHVFDLPPDSLETTYRASGFIPGTLVSQFAIDARGDVLRVATTLVDFEAPSVSRITTARVEGDAIVPLGSTGDLAPGERIFAVRFLGDRAYLVTFRQVDPLFVIDLADPLHPAVLGELEIPGFSEYLHPLDANHLATVGQDVAPDGSRGGVALRIFDVSNPTAPQLVDEEVLPGQGWSPASTNHLVFTFEPRLGLVALPYNRFDGFFGPYRSSLVLTAVDVTNGFTPRGEIEHETPSGSGCPEPAADLAFCAPIVEMQRGLFIDNWIYSISSAAVQVHALDDLTTPIAEVRLPAPDTGPLPLEVAGRRE